jgi:hypothetical protein
MNARIAVVDQCIDVRSAQVMLPPRLPSLLLECRPVMRREAPRCRHAETGEGSSEFHEGGRASLRRNMR